jgi:hypothetical protein
MLLTARGRLYQEYERKEGARRDREWRRRGVLLEDLPRPTIELLAPGDR